MKEDRFLTALKRGDVEKLSSHKDFKAHVSFPSQEKLTTSLKEMYKVKLRCVLKEPVGKESQSSCAHHPSGPTPCLWASLIEISGGQEMLL